MNECKEPVYLVALGAHCRRLWQPSRRAPFVDLLPETGGEVRQVDEGDVCAQTFEMNFAAWVEVK